MCIRDRARTILGPQRALFAAIFFVAFGLRTDPQQLRPFLLLGILLAVAGTLSKLATGWYAARRDGVSRRGRLRAGLTLAARGEFSIIIGSLAAASGHPEVGLLATTYVLVLAFVGPCLLYTSRCV